MERAWQELRAGAKDARWTLYFLLALLPTTLAAVALAYAWEGRLSTPPSGLTCWLAGLGSLVSLLIAGVWDGPDGRLGRFVWTLALVAVVLWLVRRSLRAAGQRQSATVRLAGHGFTVELEAQDDGQRGTHWDRRENIHHRWLREKDSPEGGVLIPS
jgi:hypothetical protein